MFRFLPSSVNKPKDVLLKGDPTPLIRFLGNPFLIRSISISSSSKNTHHRSFTVSYLINSCGFSQERALAASKTFQLKNSAQPDSVLALFRSLGIPNTHIFKIIHKRPALLRTGLDKTLKPKLEFFRKLGLTETDLAEVISRDPNFLAASLENSIIPNFDILMWVFGSIGDVIFLLKRSTSIFRKNINLTLKIDLLRAQGVPNSNISKLLLTQPRVFNHPLHRFEEIIEEVKQMGINPSKYAFVSAVQALGCMSISTIQSKFDVFEKWGWTKEQILSAFRRNPRIFMLSSIALMDKMNLFVKMGYNLLSISRYPTVLTYSMEKRIIPRCMVIQVLMSNGLVEKDYKINSYLGLSDRDFLKKFVNKFEKEIPELLRTYQGKMNNFKPNI